MLDWFFWLIETKPFITPSGPTLGWDTQLGHVLVAGNLMVWVADFTAAALMILLALKGDMSTFTTQRQRGLLFLFATLMFWAGVLHLMRGVMYFWPAYRLLATVNVIKAIVAWAVVAFAVVIILAQRRDPVKDSMTRLHEELDRMKETMERIQNELPERLRKKILEERKTHGG